MFNLNRRIKSTPYMRNLLEIEQLYKDGFKYMSSSPYYVTFRKYHDDGIISTIMVTNRYIEYGVSVNTLALELKKHFEQLNTHNP